MRVKYVLICLIVWGVVYDFKYVYLLQWFSYLNTCCLISVFFMISIIFVLLAFCVFTFTMCVFHMFNCVYHDILIYLHLYSYILLFLCNMCCIYCSSVQLYH